jgi:hypothetical protein
MDYSISKEYRSTRRSKFEAIRFVLVRLIPFLFFLLLVFSNFWKTDRQLDQRNPIASNLFLGVMTIVVVLFFLLFLLIGLSYLFARLVLSSTGIEYHRWPLPGVTCTWNEVDRIWIGEIAGKHTAILVTRRRQPGKEIRFRSGTLGSSKYQSIPLSDFQGWSDGTIKENLSLYLPNLFAEPS